MGNIQETLKKLREEQAAKNGGKPAPAPQAAAPPPKPAPPPAKAASNEPRAARSKAVDMEEAYGGIGDTKVWSGDGNKNWERCGTYIQRCEQMVTSRNGVQQVYFEIEKTVVKVLAADPMAATGAQHLQPHPLGDVCYHRVVKKNHMFLPNVKTIIQFFGGGLENEGSMTKDAIEKTWLEACKIASSDAQPFKGKVFKVYNYVRPPREMKDGDEAPEAGKGPSKPFTKINYKQLLTLEDLAKEMTEEELERFWPGGAGLELVDG